LVVGLVLQDMIDTNDRHLAEGQLLQALQLAASSIRELQIPHRLGQYDQKVWSLAVCK
jgi:hypothetical protein